jgi:pimeloyl-ACP methyl ester carboxylesterase
MPTRHEPSPLSRPHGSEVAERVRWAGLAGRMRGAPTAPTSPIVLLHGLTFDRRMWDPLLDALPADQCAIAFDLPGHGASPALDERGLAPVVDAICGAISDAGLEAPIVVGHSIGGPLASIYAVSHPTSGVVSIDAPIRIEPFAERLRALRPLLAGERFADTWAGYQASFGLDRLAATERELLRAGDHASQDVVLSYQADILERPLRETLRWMDAGHEVLRAKGTPYVSLHATPVDAADREWLGLRLPQAEILVWPAPHHFPHLAEPDRLASMLIRMASVPARVEPRRRSGEGSEAEDPPSGDVSVHPLAGEIRLGDPRSRHPSRVRPGASDTP